MSQNDSEDTMTYRVVLNHEDQYSIWLADQANPPGWRDGGLSGTKAECLAYIGKVSGAGLGAYLGGMSRKSALAVGFGMNARGAMEIILATLALNAGLIGEKIFVALVVMALITSLSSGPLMKKFITN